jgi:hypothetical protein
MTSKKQLLVVLTSLRAEGTPRLVLSLCREWRRLDIEPRILVLFEKPSDLRAEYDAEGIQVECLHWPPKGWMRYPKLAARGTSSQHLSKWGSARCRVYATRLARVCSRWSLERSTDSCDCPRGELSVPQFEPRLVSVLVASTVRTAVHNSHRVL